MAVLIAIFATVVMVGVALWCVAWLVALMFGFGAGEAAKAAVGFAGAILGVGVVVVAAVVGLAAVWSGVS